MEDEQGKLLVRVAFKSVCVCVYVCRNSKKTKENQL